MRNRIIDYTFTPGERSITLTKFATVTVPDIRLIVNETQKVVICSSMQKDLVTCSGNVITFVDTLPALQAGDQLTIEVDTGHDFAYAGGEDWYIKARFGGVETAPIDVTYEMIRDIIILTNNNVTCWDSMFKGARIKSLDLSGLVSANGAPLQYWCQNSTTLEKVDAPDLVSLYNNFCAIYMFDGCVSLKEVYMPKLQSLGGGNVVGFMFRGCSSLYKIVIGIGATVGNASNLNPLFSVPSSGMYNTTVTDLTLVGDTATADIHIERLGGLSKESVVDVLNHIADVGSGTHSVYLSNLVNTTYSGDADYDAAVARVGNIGWTIVLS